MDSAFFAQYKTNELPALAGLIYPDHVNPVPMAHRHAILTELGNRKNLIMLDDSASTLLRLQTDYALAWLMSALSPDTHSTYASPIRSQIEALVSISRKRPCAQPSEEEEEEDKEEEESEKKKRREE